MRKRRLAAPKPVPTGQDAKVLHLTVKHAESKREAKRPRWAEYNMDPTPELLEEPLPPPPPSSDNPDLSSIPFDDGDKEWVADNPDTGDIGEPRAPGLASAKRGKGVAVCTVHAHNLGYYLFTLALSLRIAFAHGCPMQTSICMRSCSMKASMAEQRRVAAACHTIRHRRIDPQIPRDAHLRSRRNMFAASASERCFCAKIASFWGTETYPCIAFV